MSYCPVISRRPGLNTKHQHTIEMTNESPFVRRSCTVPYAWRPQVEELFKDMLCFDIIKREAPEYSSLMTITKKQNGSVRICLDARILNEKISADCESPPCMEDLLQRFHGVRYLTSIDLRSSYCQVPLHSDSYKYTAFLYNGRSYTYQVLSLGLKTALASCSRCMELVLGPEVPEFAVNYIDDILIGYPNFRHIYVTSRLYYNACI